MRLHHARTEEGIDDGRGCGALSVGAHQLVQRPVQRKGARIPQGNAVVVYPNPNRCGMVLVPVGDCIQHRFPQGLSGRWRGFAPADALVGDCRPCILGAEQIHGAVHLGQQVVFNDVLIGEIGFPLGL